MRMNRSASWSTPGRRIATGTARRIGPLPPIPGTSGEQIGLIPAPTLWTCSASVRICTARATCVAPFFNKIKQCRWVAPRYDKLAANDLAFIQLASIRPWLQDNGSTP
jgi:hypothetical protein